ncbi:MAG TPA: RICIN domain-containing protein [Polyangiaceae bacterium]|nr:RICIN domain-containing protein [Polyangiaceae bacterium]
MRLLRTGRWYRVQLLGWFAVLAGPLSCSIYDQGLDPHDQGAPDGASGAAGRRDASSGKAGSGASDAGGPGETESGIEEDAGENEGGRSGGAGGATRMDAAIDGVFFDVNRGDTWPRADVDPPPDTPAVDTGVVDGGRGGADVVADGNGGPPDVDASLRDVATLDTDDGALPDVNQGIDADPDRRGATPDGGPVVGVSYNIIAQHSGKCMTVLGNLPFDGTNILQFVCDGSPSQQFRLQAVTPTSYVIIHPASNKCVDVKDSGTADETDVALYSCNNTVAQIFALKLTTSPGFFTMVNPNSGKCVDVDSARMADLANIQIYTCNGGLNQAWEFVDVNRDQ